MLIKKKNLKPVKKTKKLEKARAEPKRQIRIFSHSHTWIRCWRYVRHCPCSEISHNSALMKCAVLWGVCMISVCWATWHAHMYTHTRAGFNLSWDVQRRSEWKFTFTNTPLSISFSLLNWIIYLFKNCCCRRGEHNSSIPREFELFSFKGL